MKSHSSHHLLLAIVLLALSIQGCGSNPLAEIKVGMPYSEAVDRLERFRAKPDQLEMEPQPNMRLDSYLLKSGRVFTLEGKATLDRITECLDLELPKHQRRLVDVDYFFADR